MNSYVPPSSRDPFRQNNYQNEMTLSYLRQSRKLHGLEDDGGGGGGGGGSGRQQKSLEEEAVIKRSSKDKTPILANLSGTRYDIVKKVALECGFEVTTETDYKNCYLIWSDAFISTERISELKPYQRINHFPGMGEISRKDSLAKNMSIMSNHKPEDYNFVPKTWVLPQDYTNFLTIMREDKKRGKQMTYIVKPPNGAMGNGIRIYRNGEQIPASENCIVQEYIDKPFLIDGYKCDLRIYVLMTSCDPMRIFIYEEGLLRLSTERYVPPSSKSSTSSVISRIYNKESLYMHLTNYSVNKHNDNYEKGSNEFTGSKRSLRFFNEYLRKNGCDVAQIWRNIVDMIVKTMILANPHVFHAYRICRPGQIAANDSVSFEVLGFDVILDNRLRPWLLEVNRSPSFGTDEELDKRVKAGLLKDTFRLINIRPSDKKRNLDALRTQSQRRLFGGSRSRLDHSADQETMKRQKSIEKKKEELRELLVRVRYDAKRDDFEAKNCGRFRRIFPVDDKFRQQHYAELMLDAFAIFNKKKGTSLQKEVQFAYMKKLKSFGSLQVPLSMVLTEDDIIEMMAEYESQETRTPSRVASLGRGNPLHSSNRSLLDGMSDTDSNATGTSGQDSDSDPHHHQQHTQLRSHRSRTSSSKGVSSLSSRRSLPPTQLAKPSSSSLPSQRQESPLRKSPEQSSKSGPLLTTVSSAPSSVSQTSSASVSQLSSLNNSLSAEDVEKVKVLQKHLQQLFIKFPGKSQEEAQELLSKLRSDWSTVGPQVASYWLVKLDTVKRKRVIDIVRSNVTALLQRAYSVNNSSTEESSQLRLDRIFNKLYNRMLWSQGQGLWDSFSNKKSWETMFVKSSDTLDPLEMECCARVVNLCQDCLLVVYQYASDSRNRKDDFTINNNSNSSTIPLINKPPSSLSSQQPPSYAIKRQGSSTSTSTIGMPNNRLLSMTRNNSNSSTLNYQNNNNNSLRRSASIQSLSSPSLLDTSSARLSETPSLDRKSLKRVTNNGGGSSSGGGGSGNVVNTSLQPRGVGLHNSGDIVTNSGSPHRTMNNVADNNRRGFVSQQRNERVTTVRH